MSEILTFAQRTSEALQRNKKKQEERATAEYYLKMIDTLDTEYFCALETQPVSECTSVFSGFVGGGSASFEMVVCSETAKGVAQVYIDGWVVVRQETIISAQRVFDKLDAPRGIHVVFKTN